MRYPKNCPVFEINPKAQCPNQEGLLPEDLVIGEGRPEDAYYGDYLLDCRPISGDPTPFPFFKEEILPLNKTAKEMWKLIQKRPKKSI